MKIFSMNHAKHFIAVFVCLFIVGGQPNEFGDEETFFQGFLIKKPVIKIGLGINLRKIEIHASSGMNIYAINSDYNLIAEDADEALIKAQGEKLSEKYVIQVDHTQKREEAEFIVQELEKKINHHVYISENRENRIKGLFQIRIGDFITREDALDYIKKLNKIGIKNTWILKEEVADKDSKPLWILVNDELKSLNNKSVLYFIPSDIQSYLSYGHRDYRGLFVLKPTKKGIVLINILNVEDYLKSVVPSELSPYTFSEMEAHKAQAVAARTYAIKNMKTNEDTGFDLRDTPAAQYYKGKSAEHDLSNQAVELTKGEVASYKNELINALYTSTCGGRTENVENIFGGPALPYLRGTKCIYESQKSWIIQSNQTIAPIMVNGNNVSSEIASLISLNVISPIIDPDYYQRDASLEEGVTWIRNALTLFGIDYVEFVKDVSSIDFKTLAQLIMKAFKWENRVENLLQEDEINYVLRDLEGLEGNVKKYMAYLIKSEIFPPPIDIKEPDRVLKLGEMAYILNKVIKNYMDFFDKGLFKGIDKENRIIIEEGDKEKRFILKPNTFFIEKHGEEFSFVSRFHLLGGEKVQWIGDGEKISLLQVMYSPYTNILDRNSEYHSWQRRISRKDLEKKINQYYPIGTMIDINPLKRGVSKRVIQLQVNGSESDVVIKGFRIRRILGLRETFFVIDRDYDQNGKIEKFIFSGKGWGHGVGLCQVGAYGMARKGANYKQILKKYYKGIKIEKIY